MSPIEAGSAGRKASGFRAMKLQSGDTHNTKSAAGFTLIEVMIALVIVGICSVFALSHAANATHQQRILQQRTLATWVAQNQIARYRLDPTLMDKEVRYQEQQMGHQRWGVNTQVIRQTDQKWINILVEVSALNERAGAFNDSGHLVSLNGYMPQPAPESRQ